MNPSKKNEEFLEESSALRQKIQELEKSERQQRSCLENAGDAIYLLQADSGRIQNCNAQACLDLGYGRDELLKLSSMDIESRLSSEEVDAIHDILKIGEVKTVEGMHKRKDGSVFPVEIRFSLIPPAEQGLIVAIVRDITERKRVADEMAIITEIGRVIGSTLNIDEVYERFATEVRKLIPFDRIHVNLKDPDGENFTVAYVSGTDIAGRRPGDKVPLAGSITDVLIRTRISILLNPMGKEDVVRRFPSASAATTFRVGMRSILAVPLISGDEAIGGLHFRSKKRNGYTEQDLLLAERIGSQIAGAIANARIFQDLNKAERELRESEEKYRILFHNDRTAIYIFDLETLRFLDANEASSRLYGYSCEEMVGGLRALDLSAEPEKSAGSYEIANKMGTVFIPMRLHRKKDGTVFPVEIVGGVYTWKGRRVIFGIIQDITERKRMEESLKETMQQLESRVRERTLELEETNTALRVLLKKGEKEQKRLEDNLQSNINQLVAPFLSKLRVSRSNLERQTYLNILETNLNNIVSPFVNRLSATYTNLTPKEIQIAELVKQGKRSKEIALLFGISVGTVISHRNKIRKKLALKSRNTSLSSHLLSLV